jgi:hypothetical protein
LVPNRLAAFTAWLENLTIETFGTKKLSPTNIVIQGYLDFVPLPPGIGIAMSCSDSIICAIFPSFTASPRNCQRLFFGRVLRGREAAELWCERVG